MHGHPISSVHDVILTGLHPALIKALENAAALAERGFCFYPCAVKPSGKPLLECHTGGCLKWATEESYRASRFKIIQVCLCRQTKSAGNCNSGGPVLGQLKCSWKVMVFWFIMKKVGWHVPNSSEWACTMPSDAMSMSWCLPTLPRNWILPQHPSSKAGNELGVVAFYFSVETTYGTYKYSCIWDA